MLTYKILLRSPRGAEQTAWDHRKEPQGTGRCLPRAQAAGAEQGPRGSPHAAPGLSPRGPGPPPNNAGACPPRNDADVCREVHRLLWQKRQSTEQTLRNIKDHLVIEAGGSTSYRKAGKITPADAWVLIWREGFPCFSHTGPWTTDHPLPSTTCCCPNNYNFIET